jgi:hypothetical protein
VNSFDNLRQALTFVIPPKKSSALGAALQPLDVNQETLREARSQKGRLQVQRLRRKSSIKKSGTSKPSNNRSRGRRTRCFVSPTFRRRSMRPLRKCVISLKMTRTEDLNAESFVRTILTMMTNGMMISSMEFFLLMMLLLC